MSAAWPCPAPRRTCRTSPSPRPTAASSWTPTRCWRPSRSRWTAVWPARVSGLTPRFASRWPRLARARWYPAHGDGACSNLGSDCAGPDRVALNVGTSCAMRLVAPEGLGQGGPTPWGLWRYRVDARRSLIGGATSEGGNVLAWCRRVLALPADDEDLERAVAEIPPG